MRKSIILTRLVVFATACTAKGLAILLVAAAVGLSGVACIQSASDQEPSGTATQIDGGQLGRVRLPFIENQGQVNPEVRFYATTFAGSFFVTDKDLTYALVRNASEGSPKGMSITDNDLTAVLANSLSSEGIAIKERFLTKRGFHPAGLDKSNSAVNYFVGERDGWRSNIPTYNAVDLGEVWPRVEVELLAYGKNVEKVFKVKPGGRLMISDLPSLG